MVNFYLAISMLEQRLIGATIKDTNRPGIHLPQCGALYNRMSAELSRADKVRSLHSPLLINLQTWGLELENAIFINSIHHFTMVFPFLRRVNLTRQSLGISFHQVAKPAVCPYRIKYFSTKSYCAMLTTELSEAEVSALRVNNERLAKDLHHSCQWGYGIRWGE